MANFSTRRIILKLIEQKKRIKTSDIVYSLKNKVSRQYVARVLKELVESGQLVKMGSTKNTLYTLPRYKDRIEEDLGSRIHKRLVNRGLKEHEVLDEINRSAGFLVNVDENVRSIFDYAFSEMFNNAIEHSQSKFIEFDVFKEGSNIFFQVNDFGIGVFKNVMQKRNLNSELEAIQDLLKGKTTTQPHAHSGEGIFFTSKVADIFILESFGLRLRIDNTINDIFIEPVMPGKKGTRVTFILLAKSQKHLSDVFRAFSSGASDIGFDKTEIRVKLYTMGTIYVSRSQARRVLSGLEKFKSIILDFEQVPTIGQAFADEIFRVFQSKHLDIEIQAINTNEAVKFMIDRVEKPKPTLF